MLIKCLINEIINEFHTDSLDALDRIIFPTEVTGGGQAPYKVNGGPIIPDWKVEIHVQF